MRGGGHALGTDEAGAPQRGLQRGRLGAVGRVLLATLSTRAHALGLHTELVAAAGQITISREPRKSPSASPLALPPSPWLRVRVRPWHEACGGEDHLHVTSSASGEPVRLREGGGELAELTRLLFNVMAP